MTSGVAASPTPNGPKSRKIGPRIESEGRLCRISSHTSVRSPLAPPYGAMQNERSNPPAAPHGTI